VKEAATSSGSGYGKGNPYGMGLQEELSWYYMAWSRLLQIANFARIYAIYGGIFIVLSLLWAWTTDGVRPDRYDIIGAIIALIGVCIIFYAPRNI